MSRHTIILTLVCMAAAGGAGRLSRSPEKVTWGGLYPRESVSREVKSLDGLWDFRLVPLHDQDKGFREEWFKQPLRKVC